MKKLVPIILPLFAIAGILVIIPSKPDQEGTFNPTRDRTRSSDSRGTPERTMKRDLTVAPALDRSKIMSESYPRTYTGTIQKFEIIDGNYYVHIDFVYFFRGDEATAACREDGQCDLSAGVMNDYYIRDLERNSIMYPMKSSTTATFAHMSPETPNGTYDLRDFYNIYHTSDVLSKALYVFDFEAGVITSVTEQYVP